MDCIEMYESLGITKPVLDFGERVLNELRDLFCRQHGLRL